MSDDLFSDTPHVPLTPLQCARFRLASAQADYDKAKDLMDNTGNAIPVDTLIALDKAKHAVLAAELETMKRVGR